MANVSWKKKQRDHRKQEVLRCTLDLVSQGGIDDLTMPRLAESLGLAVGGLYRYFSSKDALMAELGCWVLNTLHQDQKRFLVEKLNDDPNRDLSVQDVAMLKLLLLAQHYVAFEEKNPVYFKLIQIMSGDPRILVSGPEGLQVMEAMFAIFQDVRDMFESAIVAGVLKPGSSEDRSLIYWASLQGVLQTKKFKRFESEPFDIHRLCMTLIETLLIGWGAKRSLIRACM